MFEKLAKKVVLRSSVLPSGIRLMLLLLLFEMCGKHEEKEKVYFRCLTTAFHFKEEAREVD